MFFSVLSISLGILAVYSMASTADGLNWFQRKRYHRLANISDDELRLTANAANKTRFGEYLTAILKPRVQGTDGNREVAEYLKNEMENYLKWSTEIHQINAMTADNKPFYGNIISTRRPYHHRRLVLACHYDSLYIRYESFLGATDSAVPCAMLLHLGYVLNKLNVSNSGEEGDNHVSPQFIFFDGREPFNDGGPDTYGSRFLAQDLSQKLYTPYNEPGNDKTTELDRIDCLIVLSLLGARAPRLPIYPSTSRWYKELAAIETSLMQKGLLSYGYKENMLLKSEPNSKDRIDDHTAFHAKNVDVLPLLPRPFPDVWHKIGDDKSALDFDTIDDLNRVLQVFVVRYIRGMYVEPEPTDDSGMGLIGTSSLRLILCITAVVLHSGIM